MRAHPEDRFQAELKASSADPGVAKALSWVFAFLLGLVPLTQISSEALQGKAPQVLNLFQPLLRAGGLAASGSMYGARRWLEVLTSREFPKAYEKDLEDASIAKAFVQPRVQSFLTGQLGFGNNESVVGRDGWLFYQPGVDYLAGPDFTDSFFLRSAAKSILDRTDVAAPVLDPRPAILDLLEDCKKRNISLVVLPIPEKGMLQPAQLTARMDFQGDGAPPNNRGYAAFVAGLRARGVTIYDAVPPSIRRDDARFLVRDTHWAPGYMETTAAGVAAFLLRRQSVSAPPAEPVYLLETSIASTYGDLEGLLRLPADQKLYGPQTFAIHRVVNMDGSDWHPDRTAEVMVAGDSFVNIYSHGLGGMGSGAGFAEHLSYHLGRGVDVVGVAGGGSAGTREELVRAAKEGRLSRTRVIIYEFAMRSLFAQAWPPERLPAP